MNTAFVVRITPLNDAARAASAESENGQAPVAGSAPGRLRRSVRVLADWFLARRA